MEINNVIDSSVIKGLIFCALTKSGPQPIYVFPKEVSEIDAEKFKKINVIKLTAQNYLQIAVKNLSLLSWNYGSIDSSADVSKSDYFGIIPYPDFELTSVSFFHLIKSDDLKAPIFSVFSVLVEEIKRNFLYNNINRLRPIILDFCGKLDKEVLVQGEFKPQNEVEHFFLDLITKIIKIEKNPTAAIASRRKMKILFTGLDDTGKTSFLLSIDKKYSKLLSLKPTLGTEVISIDALGASFFVWDLGGQISSRERYINKAHIYLYESDLIFYFIDIRNKSRFEDSLEYLQNILIQLNKFEQHPPIIFVFSKGDADILNSDEIKENIKFLRSRLIEFTSNKNPEIYITSIFSTFSILRAFSSGISKLSPNRDLIKLNLKKFSKKTDTPLSLLLNKDGLVLADYYSKKFYSLINIKNQSELKEKDNLKNVFEVSAPQFATLYKIFSQFKTLKEEETIFQFNENLKVLLKKIQVSDNEIYILFLIDNEIKKKKINDLLPEFINKTSDLLIRYIS